MQCTLFGRVEPRADVHFRGAERTDLGQGAWLEQVPAWLSGHEFLMNDLIWTCDWQRHKRVMYDRMVDVPRLVAGLPGDRRGLRWDASEVTVERSRATLEQIQGSAGILLELSALLSVRYGRQLSSISLGYYRTGQDSVAFHGDKLGSLRADTVVAIVSVGAVRRFLLRPKAGGKSLSFGCGEGDLLVMGGACQVTHEHAVPKVRRAGPRIAIMFRQERPAQALYRPVASARASSPVGDAALASSPTRRDFQAS